MAGDFKMNAIGDLTDVSGSDCKTWLLSESGKIQDNFIVYYTDGLVKSVRYTSDDGQTKDIIGSKADPKDEKNGPLFRSNAANKLFYGFNGYEDSSGVLSSFNSITLDRKQFDDTVSLIADVNTDIAEAKSQMAVLSGEFKVSTAVENDSAV